jgi:hypothetical protein
LGGGGQLSVVSVAKPSSQIGCEHELLTFAGIRLLMIRVAADRSSGAAETETLDLALALFWVIGSRHLYFVLYLIQAQIRELSPFQPMGGVSYSEHVDTPRVLHAHHPDVWSVAVASLATLRRRKSSQLTVYIFQRTPWTPIRAKSHGITSASKRVR